MIALASCVGCGGSSAGGDGPLPPVDDGAADGRTDALSPDAGPDASPDARPDSAPPDASSAGGFISLDPVSRFESETHLASSGASVVVAWIDHLIMPRLLTIGYAISRDGGTTFSAPQHIMAPGGREAGDPSVAADGQGGFYVSFVGFQPNMTTLDAHIYLSHLAPGGTTFGAPSAVDQGAGGDFDKPWVIVDNAGVVHVTWLDFGVNQLIAARSSDGVSWTGATVPGDGNLMYPCLDRAAGASAPLYLTFLTITDPQAPVVSLRRSIDGGTTWTQPYITDPATDAVFQDPTCEVAGDEVWIAYAQGSGIWSSMQTPLAESVRVVHSRDRGVTWSAPVTVTAATAGERYLLPALARTQAGLLMVIYYAGTDGGPATLERAVSPDGGGSWARAPLGMTGTLTGVRTARTWLGDYIGATASGASVLAVFDDNTSTCVGVAEQCSHIRFLSVTP